MKLKITIFIAFLQLFSSIGVDAQCLNLNFKNLQNKGSYKSTGVDKLDKYLNEEKTYLESIFKVSVELKVLNDGNEPNAYASSESSNAFYFDGSVYLGYKLLADEIEDKSRGLDAVSGIMAHEFAHILQEKLSCTLDGKIRELHADFLAGYYMAKRGGYTADAVTAFGTSLYAKGDGELWEASHHGTPKQRITAMLGGFIAADKVSTPKEAYEAGIELLTNGGNSGGLGEEGNQKTYKSSKSEVYKAPKSKIQSVPVSFEDGTTYPMSFVVTYTVGSTEYNGLILLDEKGGKMRVHYNDGKKDKIVQQKLTLNTTAKGDVSIQGSDVIDLDTKDYSKTYSADSFYFLTNKQGVEEVWTIDEKGQYALTKMTIMTDKDLVEKWLNYLKW